MKKLLKILGIFILLLIAAAIVLPIIFKDDIFRKVKEEANNNLNAKVDFGDFSMTLFKSFPDFTLVIDNVKVEGIDEFEGVTLAHIGSFEVTVDLMSVVKGEKIEIQSFGLVEPKLHVIVTEDGKANYDITKKSGEEETAEEPTEAKESGDFHLSLKKYYIENANIIYDDRQGNMYTELVNFSHSGSGDFTQDLFVLQTKTSAEAFTFKMDGIPYMNKVTVGIKFDMDMDMPNSKYIFKENEIRLNQLVLGFDGWVAKPGDNIDMDLTYYAKQTEFKNILSLVPAVYARDFESVQTAGKLALDGSAKGTMKDDDLPAFTLNLKVDDAMFKYPDLPKSVENIQIDVKVNNPGGDPDNTVVDVAKFYVELGGNPIDIKLKTSTPVSDPNIDCAVRAKLDLSSIKDVIPMEEGEDYAGNITADVTMKGKLSTIENEQYENFDAKGQIILLDMKYQSPDLPYTTDIKTMYLNFSPQFVELSNFDVMIGQSDIKASGKIENFLAYYFKDDPLRGRFDMTSNLMDLNELAGDEEAETEAESESAESAEGAMEVIEVPKNLNFTASAKFNKLLYDNMEMTNVAGNLTVRDGEVLLNRFKMNMLDGQLVVNGKYNTQNIKNPFVDFGLDISKFDLPKTYETFATVQKMAPIIENSKGKFSTKMNFSTVLDDKMEPMLNTLNGRGKLTTHHVLVENSGALGKLADQLKMDDFKKIELDNVNISYRFEDGKVHVEPFDVDMGDIKSNIYGWNAFDQTMNYTMEVDAPTSKLGGIAGTFTNMLGALGGEMPERLQADVLITGTVSDPKISVSLKDFANNAEDAIKKQVEEKIEEVKEEIKEKVEEKIEEVKEDVEERIKKEAAKIRKEAQKQTDKIREEANKAAEAARKAGYDNAEQLVKEAKNPIQKVAAKEAAKKVKKEADKKARQIKAEGVKNAQKVLKEAEAKIKNLK
ncbi:MAG: hypothetical protein COA57_12615 [Flavobacteriales bacterium]|nr:MAG: hypothetical protein COA57_12615 [Flavobacteriales bacterium]